MVVPEPEEQDLTLHVADGQADWDDFWDSEPFEKWRRGGVEWR